MFRSLYVQGRLVAASLRAAPASRQHRIDFQPEQKTLAARNCAEDKTISLFVGDPEATLFFI